LHTLQTESAGPKLLLAAAALLIAVAAYFGAKWNLANAVSTRVDTRQMADFAVDLGPSDPQTHYAAAVIYQRTFEPADDARSLAEFEKAAELAPNNYLVMLELGRAYGRSGDTQRSLATLSRALELAPNYADVQWAYGNALIRAGEADKGFDQIRAAINGRRELAAPAVAFAMQLFDADMPAVRAALGDSDEANAAAALYFAKAKRFDDAIAVWSRVGTAAPVDKLPEQLQLDGRTLESLLRDVKKFRAAYAVGERLWGVDLETGSIYNGGFENAVMAREAKPFDWQIAAGVEPQIALSNAQKMTGENSLLMIFNITQAAEFRGISQTVAVEPGKAYRFEAYYKSELKATATLRWEIYDAVTGTMLAATSAVAAQSDWQSVTANVPIPTGTDGITIRLARHGCASAICPITGRMWLDDISLRRKD
jgi:tetratricopeptide (TPR) repeat protein